MLSISVVLCAAFAVKEKTRIEMSRIETIAKDKVFFIPISPKFFVEYIISLLFIKCNNYINRKIIHFRHKNPDLLISIYKDKCDGGNFMHKADIYEDIAKRTGGDIYIGVVGPVRTGKSTFIKRFMDSLVIPNMESSYSKERATDELPQSSAGRTIMTTEPKFIPEKAVEVNLGNGCSFKTRLIDCVGYIVPSSLGYIEDDQPRMVMTPWYDEPIPFNMAAEIGTKKVITEHSTIGLVVTTDGSISDIPRIEYEEAEERVIEELKEINKPFVVLLNSMYPESDHAQELATRLSQKYSVSVVPVNCLELNEANIKEIIYNVLREFPVREIRVSIPRWITALDCDNPIRSSIFSTVAESAKDITKISMLFKLRDDLCNNENVLTAEYSDVDLGTGVANLRVEIENSLFYKVLSSATGIEVGDEQELMQNILELAAIKKEYQKVKNALDEVEATGYGIVMPSIDELALEEPEIVRQGGRYGVRLRASAPSIHMMKANITTEVNPVVGSERQSEDLVMYLLKGFEEDPAKIWESNIFGKSLHELVNEGLHTKLSHMPMDARVRLGETLEKIINEGCNGLICIIL